MFSIFSRPFDSKVAVALEGAKKAHFRDIPRHSADKDFAGVDRVAVDSRREHSAPSAGRLADCCRAAVQASSSLDRKRVIRRGSEQLVGTPRPLKSCCCPAVAIEAAAVGN